MKRGKKPDQIEVSDDGVAKHGVDQGATAGEPRDRFEELSEMMEALMQSQKQQETNWQRL